MNTSDEARNRKTMAPHLLSGSESLGVLRLKHTKSFFLFTSQRRARNQHQSTHKCGCEANRSSPGWKSHPLNGFTHAARALHLHAQRDPTSLLCCACYRTCMPKGTPPLFSAARATALACSNSRFAPSVAQLRFAAFCRFYAILRCQFSDWVSILSAGPRSRADTFSKMHGGPLFRTLLGWVVGQMFKTQI